MTATIYKVSNRNRLHAAVADYFAAMPEGESRVLIVPNSDAVTAWRKIFALSYPQASFNMKIMTFFEYIEEKWGLFGGPLQVSRPTISKMAMLATLINYQQQNGYELLRPSSGTVQMLYDVASAGLGDANFEATLRQSQAADFSDEPNGKVWHAICLYRDFLHANGFMEMGEVLEQLAVILPATPCEVAVGFDYMSSTQIAFFEERGATVFLERGNNDIAFAKIDSLMQRFSGLAQEYQLNDYDESVENDACGSDMSVPTAPEILEIAQSLYTPEQYTQATGAVRFVFSTGMNIEAASVANAIKQVIAQGYKPEDIYVVDRALPADLRVQQLLWQSGIGSTGMCMQSVKQSDLGKAYTSYVDEQLVSSICEYTLSTYSGVSPKQAQKLNAEWLCSRNSSRESCLNDISKQGGLASSIVNAEADGHMWTLLQLMLKAHGIKVAGKNWEHLPSAQTPLSIQISRSVAEKIYAILDLGMKFNLDYRQSICMFEVEGAGARYQIDGSNPQDGCVTFGGFASLACQDYKVVLIPGMDVNSFPVTKDADPSQKLLLAAGVYEQDDYLEKCRYEFYQAITSADRMIVVHRSLSGEKSEELCASVLFEELTDCYRQDISDFDALDKLTSLPGEVIEAAKHIDGLVQVDAEDDISQLTFTPAYEGQQSVRICDRTVQFATQINLVDARDMCDASKQTVAQMAVGSVTEPKLLSASAVEMYMQCPMRWFIERKIKPECLNAELGNLALGTLVHAVLMRVYMNVSHDGQLPVRMNEFNNAQITSMVEAAYQDYKAECQSSSEFNPLQNLTSLEERDVQQKVDAACRLLIDDKIFLRSFTPTLFERTFGEDDQFEYAGHPFRGTIDRIDVDKNGRAIVIDYKGSVKDYKITRDKKSGQISESKRVQALIYAAAASRVLGCDVHGSLYRSYSKRRNVAGAYDEVLLGSHDVFDSEESLGVRPEEFQELLHTTEQRVAQAIQRMRNGDITPRPCDKSVCEHCPSISCERRLA